MSWYTSITCPRCQSDNVEGEGIGEPVELIDPENEGETLDSFDIVAFHCRQCGYEWVDGETTEERKIPSLEEIKRAMFHCDVCGEQLPNGRKYFDHMRDHFDPATARRAKEEIGIDGDDFLGFCIQEGFDVFGSPDDPLVTQAIEMWRRMGDDPFAELLPLTTGEPAPDIWGEGLRE